MSGVRIRLGREDISLRPSFRAVQNIEERLDASISQLYQALRLNALTLAEAAVIVTEGANEAGAALKGEDVARALFERGIGSDAIRAPIGKFLLECAYGPDEGKKKFLAEWPESTPPLPGGSDPANTSRPSSPSPPVRH